MAAFDKTDDFLFSELKPRQEKVGWFGIKKGIIISLVFSFFWLIFVAQYLSHSGWWANRLDLAPAELVGGLAGLMLPAVLVWLISAYFDRSEQLAEEARLLKSYLNELVYPTEEGAIYTQTLTDALRVQIKEFRDVFNDVNTQTQSVRDDLKGWIQDLSRLMAHVDTETVGSIREIAGHIQRLTAATDTANEEAQKASDLFSEQAVILQRITDQTVASVVELSRRLSENAAELETTTHTIVAANETMDSALNRAEQVVGDIQKTAARMDGSIDLYETSAKQQNARLFGNLEKVLSVFKAHGALLDKEVEKSAAKVSAAEAVFSDKAEAMFQIADQAVKKVTEAGEVYHSYVQTLSGQMAQMTAETDAMARQLKETVAALPMGKPEGDVLKEASAILDKLQAFSVDMAHLFSPKTEESLWESYYTGDKTVFMRHIAQAVSGAKVKKIQEFYQKNDAFQTAVQKYMKTFADMTKVLQNNDKDGLFMAVLLGSDAGRLYMVLTQILK